MILAVWLLSLPFRLLAALGLRRSVILACLFVLAVTAYSVAEDLACSTRPPGPLRPASRPPASLGPVGLRSPTSLPAICACTAPPAPATASLGRCWPPLARSSPTTAGPGCPGSVRGATGPGPVGRCSSAACRAARPATPGPATATAAPTTPPRRSRPRLAIWSTTAPATTWTGPSTPTTTPGPTWPGSSSWPAATPVEGVGGGERPHHPPPGQGAGLDQAADRGLLRGCGTELARHPNQNRALRAARRRRCPACGTRSAARLPGTTSLAADLALARGQPTPLGRRRWPPARQVASRSRPAGRR
jgi:hypothetical protein